MTSTKSLYSWDVIIKKYNDKLFIDKRDEPNILDYLTVNETSNENQPFDDETVNGVRQLMKEAKEENDAWLYQSYSKDKFDSLKEQDPFIEIEGQVAARVGYIYNVWKLADKERICIRSTVHNYIPQDNIYAQETSNVEGEEQKPKRTYQNCYALTEYEPNKVNYPQYLAISDNILYNIDRLEEQP